MAGERITYVTRVREASPPWLLRSVGGRVMTAIAEVIDTLVDRASDGVSHRFPGLVDNSALTMIGRERRIRRGPGEAVATYARRLRPWWDRHRVRGGPYALLGQLHDFFLAWLPGRKDVVYHSGTRRWIDEAGEITRDSITWEADGTPQWAQVWVFFYLDDDLIELEGDVLATTWGEILTTLDGEPLGTTYTIALSALTALEAEVFKCIPREWSAAHVMRTHVVLLPGDAALVGYPPRLVGEEGQTVGRTDAPTILLIEDGA